MQQKNFVLFIILCVAILAGWMWFQSQMWPPKKKDEQPPKEKSPPTRSVDPMREAVARLIAGVPATELGVVNALRLRAEVERIAKLAGPATPNQFLLSVPPALAGLMNQPP